jgi:pyroglutamyl-peptidase
LKPLILLIGYSVFAGFQINPAEEVVVALNGYEINGLRVKSLVLPVSYRVVKEKLPSMLENEEPAAVIGVGLAPRAIRPILELSASNIASFTARDEEGKMLDLDYIDSVGELRVVKTRIPVENVLSECRRRGLEIRPGVSIGTYLCGVAGYIIMRYAWDHNVPGGFIHIPPSTELAMRHRLPNYMPLGQIIETIRCIIDVVSAKASQALQQNSQ